MPPAGYRRAAAFADQPVFAEVIRGIETVTDAAGYQTMLAHYGYQAEKEEDRPVSLLSYNIDGLILAERTHTPRTLKMLATAGIPWLS